jgi:hypothetical protein
MEANQAAQQFWINVISDYTKGQFPDIFKTEDAYTILSSPGIAFPVDRT